MSSSVSRILQFRQLNAAKELSARSDFDIIIGFGFWISSRIPKQSGLCSVGSGSTISGASGFSHNGGYSTYAAALVGDVLESCLSQRIPTNESPHCKIVLEAMLTLFWYHQKSSVMTLAIPVAIKALSTENEEIIRNTASYLCLAAQHNGRLVGLFARELATYVLKGRYELIHIFPLIYSKNQKPINDDLAKLLSVLCKPVDFSVKLSLLNLALDVTKQNPDLIVPHLSELDDLLLDSNTCSSTLKIFLSLIDTGRFACLTGQLVPLREAAQHPSCSSHNLLTLAKIFSVVAICVGENEQLREVAIQDVVQCCRRLSAQHLATGFQELEIIAVSHPSALINHLAAMKEMSENVPAAFILYNRICASVPDGGKFSSSAKKDFAVSMDSLLSKRPLSSFSQPLHLATVSETTEENMRNLIENNRNRHSSLSSHKNEHSKTLSLTPSNRTLSPILEKTQISETSENESSLILEKSPKTIQLCKDGRIRPVSAVRPRANWNATTTFPVHQIPEHPDEQSFDIPLDKASGSEYRNDVVKQFVEHRHHKIRRYIIELSCRYPIPMDCSVETIRGSKGKLSIHFGCEMRGQDCVHSDSLFVFRTHLASIWMHLMFLKLVSTQIRQQRTILSQSDVEFRLLAKHWERLPKEVTKSLPFAALVTSQFPNLKQQSQLLKELHKVHFFDSFSFDVQKGLWGCFSCAHPDRIETFLRNGHTLEGSLKEKKGRWSFFRRWRRKYFTLSPAALSVSGREANQTPIALNKIRTIRSLPRYGKGRRSLPKAFEIFTEDDNRMILKANDGHEAEKWFQCIQIGVARARRHSNK